MEVGRRRGMGGNRKGYGRRKGDQEVRGGQSGGSIGGRCSGSTRCVGWQSECCIQYCRFFKVMFKT